MEASQPTAHFERYVDAAGEFRYRLRAANGEIVIPPESVTRSEDVQRAVEDMLAAVDEAAPPPARIFKLVEATEAKPVAEAYQVENPDAAAPSEADVAAQEQAVDPLGDPDATVPKPEPPGEM